MIFPSYLCIFQWKLYFASDTIHYFTLALTEDNVNAAAKVAIANLIKWVNDDPKNNGISINTTLFIAN